MAGRWVVVGLEARLFGGVTLMSWSQEVHSSIERV